MLYSIFDLDTNKWLANIRAANAGETIRDYLTWPAVDIARRVFAERV